MIDIMLSRFDFEKLAVIEALAAAAQVAGS